jgi:AraC-like DNA-binding protein
VVVPERGRCEFQYRGATYRQAPGLLQLKQPGELYRDLRREGAATYDVAMFDPEVIARARMASGAGELVFELPQVRREDPRADALMALCRLCEGMDPLAAESVVAVAALALVSLGGALRAVGRERPAVQRARAYLRERLAERIRLDEVADYVGLDKYHLIRAFHAEVGAPPYEFVTHARVHRARELLRAGMAAGQVAAAVGFCDQSQLHRHFTRLVGVTPGRYVRRARSSLRAAMTIVVEPAP